MRLRSAVTFHPLLDPIPPFSDTTNSPVNWVLASTAFDTSKFDQTKSGNAYLMFGVVVWMQAADGTLVPEMPGHGLTSIPGTLNFLADVAEECQSDGNCYSNNLGLYHQIFYIAPPGLGATPGPPPEASVDIDKVELSARRITPRETVVVSATLSASGAAASGISANFYDGDPREGGKLFDLEQIPHLAESDPYLVQTFYRTNTCGEHQLFVVVNAGNPHEVIRRAPPMRVACEAGE